MKNKYYCHYIIMIASSSHIYKYIHLFFIYFEKKNIRFCLNHIYIYIYMIQKHFILVYKFCDIIKKKRKKENILFNIKKKKKLKNI